MDAPWHASLPSGRLIAEECRHCTLAFLGHVNLDELLQRLSTVPSPPSIGLAGYFDQALFLPPRHPNVCAWHITWVDPNKRLLDYVNEFKEWLKQNDYKVDDRDFLPHVTIARTPFDKNKWQKCFAPLPVITTALNLYESVGNLTYEKRWSIPLTPPFVEIDHTADIAFDIIGTTISELYQHALIALAFHHPQLLAFCDFTTQLRNIDELIYTLNALITKIDSEIGTPYKAVSYHGEIVEKNSMLHWRMIVDV